MVECKLSWAGEGGPGGAGGDDGGGTGAPPGLPGGQGGRLGAVQCSTVQCSFCKRKFPYQQPTTNK